MIRRNLQRAPKRCSERISRTISVSCNRREFLDTWTRSLRNEHNKSSASIPGKFPEGFPDADFEGALSIFQGLRSMSFRWGLADSFQSGRKCQGCTRTVFCDRKEHAPFGSSKRGFPGLRGQIFGWKDTREGFRGWNILSAFQERNKRVSAGIDLDKLYYVMEWP